MERLGFAVYAACVDFMLRAAERLHITYRDANAAMFFLLWPAVTLILGGIVIWQRVALHRARARLLQSAPR